MTDNHFRENVFKLICSRLDIRWKSNRPLSSLFSNVRSNRTLIDYHFDYHFTEQSGLEISPIRFGV